MWAGGSGSGVSRRNRVRPLVPAILVPVSVSPSSNIDNNDNNIVCNARLAQLHLGHRNTVVLCLAVLT